MKVLSAGTGAAVTLFNSSLLSDEPLIFPTDTIYGIGAPLGSLAANLRIFDIKKRSVGQAMPVLAGSYEQVWSLAENVSGDMLEWLHSVWPGGHTVIFNAREWVDPVYKKGNTIAIRLVSGWLGQAIAATSPVTATSVNRSGESPLLTADDIISEFGDCKYMLWGDSGNNPSKIVDISNGKIELIRE